LASFSSLFLSTPTTFIPSARPSLTTFSPILPTPTTPKVLPNRSIPVNPSGLNSPSSTDWWAGIIFLVIAIIRAIAYSATVRDPYSGTFFTTIDLFMHSSQST